MVGASWQGGPGGCSADWDAGFGAGQPRILPATH